MRQRAAFWIVCGLAMMVSGPVVHAQSIYATLVGVVTDESGAVVPGASVTVTNVNTQAARLATSDEVGAFRVPNLDAGDYEVKISLQGLSDATRQVTILARQTVRVDMRLAIAGATEQVQVTATRPVIETDSATIDSSVSGEKIAKLAQNFRATNNTSPIVVATLAQGVQQDRSGAISISGALPFMTSFSIDGISSQRTRGGGTSRELFPSVESIEEFKVSSASNNAEFMQVTDITTTSRSGTNSLHGSAFWFFQDSKMEYAKMVT